MYVAYYKRKIELSIHNLINVYRKTLKLVLKQNPEFLNMTYKKDESPINSMKTFISFEPHMIKQVFKRFVTFTKYFKKTTVITQSRGTLIKLMYLIVVLIKKSN
uniref:Uncharacterized protein n=1 Tax=Amorphochlora amoebiformis TaxID=1561963 RepID=A0A0H5BIT8_9EUKA|nr:hypothetical protein [Amorphochlora amoebiformis]